MEIENTSYLGYDISFLTAMRLKQENRNLQKLLDMITRQERRTLETHAYLRQQTQLDLENRIQRRSTNFAHIVKTMGKRNSISLARRESLNIVHGQNGRLWNVATGTYVVGIRQTFAKRRTSTDRSVLPLLSSSIETQEGKGLANAHSGNIKHSDGLNYLGTIHNAKAQYRHVSALVAHLQK